MNTPLYTFTVTDAELEALRIKARHETEPGWHDVELVELCEAALAGSQPARDACARILADDTMQTWLAHFEQRTAELLRQRETLDRLARTAERAALRKPANLELEAEREALTRAANHLEKEVDERTAYAAARRQRSAP